jgi:hypothetical protein
MPNWCCGILKIRGTKQDVVNIIYKTYEFNDALNEFQKKIDGAIEDLKKNICNQSHCLALKLFKCTENNDGFTLDLVLLEYKTYLYQRMLKEVFHIDNDKTKLSYMKDISYSWNEIDLVTGKEWKCLI